MVPSWRAKQLRMSKSKVALTKQLVFNSCQTSTGGSGKECVWSKVKLIWLSNGAVQLASNCSLWRWFCFIEKYVPSPKHREFKIAGKQSGNVLYLFEGECSQRPSQKWLKKHLHPFSPSSDNKMGEAAVWVAKSCDYLGGAGTVEFLLDSHFYFLEIDTRLPLEHPLRNGLQGLIWWNCKSVARKFYQ
jgi:acetyl/propionyl-CoA carboxylase alpha subunit